MAYELLESGGTIVLDGGLATALEAKGLDLKHELWSAKVLREEPEAIYQVHLDYFLAGADVATTASYQAAIATFEQYLSLDVAESKALVSQSVQLAQRARDEALKQHPSRKLIIAGSVGPYGAHLANGAEYTGDYSLSDKDMRDFHRGRVEALVDSGADILACETMPNLAEIKSLLGLLKDEFPTTQAWLSCTIKDAEHLSDGTPISEMAALANDSEQIIAVGYNCIPEGLASAALTHLWPLSTKPLIIYPNSGEQYDANLKVWHGDRHDGQKPGDLALEWRKRGAQMIGGCCRTDAKDIRNMADSLN